MFKHLLILFFLYFLAKVNFGTETTIKGYAEGFSGDVISLAEISDYLSWSLTFIDQVNIDKSGYFQLKTDVEGVKLVKLIIGDKRTSLYIKAGKVYNISLSYNDETNRNSIYDRQLDLSFDFPVKEELNQQIIDFNNDFNEFFKDKAKLFALKQRKTVIDAFKEEVLKKYSHAEGYFKEYVEYSTADLEISIASSEKLLVEQYINNKPILYHNDQYMSFLRNLFQQKFNQLTISSIQTELAVEKAINEQADFKVLVAIIKPMLKFKDQELVELFIINGLKEDYYTKKYKREKLISIFNSIIDHSTYPEHQKIAGNLIRQFTFLQQGNSAPAIDLLDKKGTLTTLSRYKNQITYIGFWSLNSLASQKEMLLIRKLHQKYGQNVHFVSILVDGSLEELKNYTNKYRDYGWDFFLAKKSVETKEKYGIKTFPYYVVLDSEGLIFRAPAASPLEDIEDLFYSYSNR